MVALYLPFGEQEGDVAKRAEEEEEANLVLTETFTLGAEECIVSESEDDHSDDKLPAVSTDANGTVGGEQGQETFDNDQEQTANATGPSGQILGCIFWFRYAFVELFSIAPVHGTPLNKPKGYIKGDLD